MTEIKIGYHEVKADYTVYQLSIADIAKKYGISWADAKKVLRDYGITTRKKDVEPVATPTYQIVLEETHVVKKIEEKLDNKSLDITGNENKPIEMYEAGLDMFAKVADENYRPSKEDFPIVNENIAA